MAERGLRVGKKSEARNSKKSESQQSRPAAWNLECVRLRGFPGEWCLWKEKQSHVSQQIPHPIARHRSPTLAFGRGVAFVFKVVQAAVAEDKPSAMPGLVAATCEENRDVSCWVCPLPRAASSHLLSEASPGGCSPERPPVCRCPRREAQRRGRGCRRRWTVQKGKRCEDWVTRHFFGEERDAYPQKRLIHVLALVNPAIHLHKLLHCHLQSRK